MTPALEQHVDPPWASVETGAAWLDLLVTIGYAYGPAPIERLTDRRRLADWLAIQGLRPLARPTEADLQAAVTLREALRCVALSTVRGERPPAADVGRVNAALAHDRPIQLGTTSGGARATLTRPATTTEALARLARQAAETLAGPGALNLRQCADTDCGMVFLDPGGRRRWCSVETCGARNRVRAHRARRRAAELS